MGGKESKLLSSVAKSKSAHEDEDFEKKAFKLWTHVDKDGSGELEKGEAMEFLGGIFDYLEKSNSAFINEYCRELPKKTVVEVWFNFFDADGNGIISRKEFQDILTLLSDPVAVAKKIQMESDQHDNQNLRIMMCGDNNVGKTSLVNRFIGETFDESVIPHSSPDRSKEVTIQDDLTVTLRLFDTQGQERFRVMTATYFQCCNGVVIVFDLTNRTSFDHLTTWMSTIELYRGHGTPCVLVGNKSDLSEREVLEEDIKKFCKEKSLPYYETSCKDDINVTEAFLSLAETLSPTLSNRKNMTLVKSNRNSHVRSRESGLNIPTPTKTDKSPRKSPRSSESKKKIK